jgi:hypothetical protein
MKSKWHLAASVFQLVVGLLAIIAFCILCSGGENIVKWIITLLLAVGYVIMGIVGIIHYRSIK